MSDLRFMTRQEYEDGPGRRRYFRGRWAYASKVIDRIRALGDVGRVLEIGPGPECLPLVVGADTMDFNKWDANFKVCAEPTIFHDAGVAPWPIEDKAYDLVLALQVFEHLKGRQRVAFEETRRVARRAILTLPFNWGNKEHKIGWKEYRRWFGSEWKDAQAVDISKRRKYMFYFEF